RAGTGVGCRRGGRSAAGGARRRAGPDPAGAGGAGAGGRGPHQPADRGGAVYQRQDRQRARVQHPRQARRRQPRRGSGYRPPPRPHRLAVIHGADGRAVRERSANGVIHTLGPAPDLKTTDVGDEMTASADIATTADEELAAAVGGGTSGAQAAIVVVGRHTGAQEILNCQLSKRYGGDYQIVVCERPAELAAWMRDLRAAGLPVALVIGGVGAQDPDGIEVLAGVRSIDSTALRVAVVGWGDWESVRSIFGALAAGKIDHWVTRPVQNPAEEFHRSMTEFLREWASGRDGGFEAVRVIGERWSARSQELRDLFSRHRVPAGFYDATSGRARQMLNELGLGSPELPVVVLTFGVKRSALVNPSNREIADAFGVMTPIPPG